MALPDITSPFQWGPGGSKKTPEQIARDRELAQLLMQQGDPAFQDAGFLGVLGRGLEGAYAGLSERRSNAAEADNAAASSGMLTRMASAMTGGGGQSFPSAPGGGGSPAPAPSTGSSSPAARFNGSQQEFVSMLLPAAMEASKRTGIDPRIIVAQAAQETGWGRSAPGNNYFGIKSHGQGGGQTFTTHEVINGQRVKMKDSFRQFASPEDSVAGYADFMLKNPRYGKLREAQGLDAQLAALGGSGYATDPNYANSVGSIARGIQLPEMPQQVASLDPSIGMAPQAMASPQPQTQAPFDLMNPQPVQGVDVPQPQQGLAPGSHGEVRVGPTGQNVKYIGGQGGAPGEWGMTQDAPMQQAGISIGDPAPQPPQPMQQMAQAMERNPMSGNMDVQPQGQPMGGMNPAILEALTSPQADPAVKNIAAILMQQQMEQQDPMRQLQMQKMQMEMEAARNPQPEYDFMAGRDGAIFRTAKDGSLEQVYGGKPETFRPLSAEEEVQYGLDPAGAYQIGADNKISKIGGEGTTVNVNQKAESAFDTEMAKGQAATFNTMSLEGLNARADLGIIGELEGLLSGQGGMMTGLQGWAAQRGIDLGGATSDLQAAQALINKLVPTQRQAGSGSMSDRDVELFTRSLPNLFNTPDGNQKIIRVMRGLAQYKQAQGEIADMVQAEEMTRQEGRQALRQLPNPLEEFRSMPAPAAPTAKKPVVIDGYTIEEIP